MTCSHVWKRVKTWEGDAAVPNGKNPVQWIECAICGHEDDTGESELLGAEWDEQLDREFEYDDQLEF